jgi:hypothetical protein
MLCRDILRKVERGFLKIWVLTIVGLKLQGPVCAKTTAQRVDLSDLHDYKLTSRRNLEGLTFYYNEGVYSFDV